MNAGGGPFAGPLRCSAINHSTCARRASSEHCRVQSGVEERSAVCRVGHACRVGTNKSKQVDNKPGPGRSWDLAVLAVVVDHIILLVVAGVYSLMSRF